MTKRGAPVTSGPGDHVFRKYVTIRILHCVVEEACLADIRVYCSDPVEGVMGRPLARVQHNGPQDEPPKVSIKRFADSGPFAASDQRKLHEDLSFISETGHCQNPLLFLRNVTNLYPSRL